MIRSRKPSEDDRTHPVHTVHRIGSTVLGLGLIFFGTRGLLRSPVFFGPGGETLGLGSNGALAVLSLAVGALLLAAALHSGRASSTTSLVVGALFLLSGFLHLGILDTDANVLGFGLRNVFFSFAAGLLLLTLGAYGRISGGLAPGNPYAARGTTEVHADDRPGDPLVQVEQAVATSRATPEQLAQLRAHRLALTSADHERAWQHFAATHSATEVARMRRASAAESALPRGR